MGGRAPSGQMELIVTDIELPGLVDGNLIAFGRTRLQLAHAGPG
jgi:hypothetical protein